MRIKTPFDTLIDIRYRATSLPLSEAVIPALDNRWRHGSLNPLVRLIERQTCLAGLLVDAVAHLSLDVLVMGWIGC